jgi:hypothetical protein
MTYNQELLLLISGAGIALISSLMTSIVTSLLSEWSSNRAKRAAKLERLYFLTGKIATIRQEDPEAIGANLADELYALKKNLPIMSKEIGLIDGAIGSLETWLELNGEKSRAIGSKGGG